MSRIQIETLGKSFDGRHVLQNISLTLETGRSLALIGPTAAGKTVLLKCLVGLYAPDQGTIRIDGADVTSPDTRAETLDDRIGMLFPAVVVDFQADYPRRFRTGAPRNRRVVLCGLEHVQ